VSTLVLPLDEDVEQPAARSTTRLEVAAAG
jgi:hypothetical protein